MKRLLLFSHYNKHDLLSEHVIFLLENIKQYYQDIVIVSNSKLSPPDKARLEELANSVITRENRGYDFSAWQQAMTKLGWEKMAAYDSVTIMNDTCFGPVFSFDEMFGLMGEKQVDFWGIVSHRRVPASETPNGKTVLEHLQSFLVTFNRSVVMSKTFQNFWESVVEKTDVDEVIENYETKLTHLLSEAGFTYSAYFDSAKSSRDLPPNLTIYSPENCFEAKMPLIKVKAFTHHRYPRYLVEKIKEESDYPVEIIENYFCEYADPNEQLLMFDKTVKLDVPKREKGQPSIGVHLHAFYMDVAEQFVQLFKKWTFDFDLFVTVSNNDLKNQITDILEKYDMKAKDIIVLPNRGYAVLPWFEVANKHLHKYEIAGHFHTKKDTHMDEWVGKVWTKDLMAMLVEPAESIINNFATNEKLGIVVPDIPTHARYLGVEMYYNIRSLRGIVEELYSRMNFSESKRQVNFDKILAYIYPYGMMYWYRPEALSPVTDLQFSEREVPSGKLPDTTVLHAIERLFVYVAWSKGYDYRIAKPSDSSYTSEFVTTLSANAQSYVRETAGLTIPMGVKSVAKLLVKKSLKGLANRMPHPVKIRLVRAFLLSKQIRARRSEYSQGSPTVKVFTHELSNTGGPRVAIDLFSQIAKDNLVRNWATPELWVPLDSKHDGHVMGELSDKEISVNNFSPSNLFFHKGDIVIMNTISYGETVLLIVLDNLARGVIRHLFLYPHEYVVDSYLSPFVTSKIMMLMRQKKLTIYTSSVQTQTVYRDHFAEQDQIKLMPNRIDINSKDISSREKDEFNKINFVITGTPDARKGELDVLYAFISFYFNNYKGNEDKYRDFSLTIVGLTDDFRDIYNKLYSDRVRGASKVLGKRVKLYGHVPEEESLEIIKEANMTVLYSLYECLPRVVFDGLAYGHPVIRNDCSGYEEQLVDGVNGWKTSTEDWQGLVDTIVEVLSKKKTSNQKLADMSKESVKIAQKFASAKYVVIDDIKKMIADN